MQFAVILHECLKCHTFYSAPIKTRWMANMHLFKRNLLLCFTWNHSCWLTSHHLCMHSVRKHTQCEQGIRVCASPDTNKYTVNHESVHALTQSLFVSLSLESTGSRERLFPRVSTCVSKAWKGTGRAHTRTHTHCSCQIDSPTHCGCKTWQVEIGKWEAHFSQPSSEQKIGAFFSLHSSCIRGGAKVSEGPNGCCGACVPVCSVMAVAYKHKRWWEGQNWNMSDLFAGGQGGGEHWNGLSRMLSLLLQNIQQT